MASGGVKLQPAANMLTLAYTNNTSVAATMNVNFCNITDHDSSDIRIAISTATSAAGVGAADYVEYGQGLPSHNFYQRTGFVVSPGESIYVFDLAGYCVVRVDGFEGVS